MATSKPLDHIQKWRIGKMLDYPVENGNLVWEVYNPGKGRLDPHWNWLRPDHQTGSMNVGGSLGRDYGTPVFNEKVNFADRIRAVATEKNVGESGMAEIFRDERGHFAHLEDITPISPDGLSNCVTGLHKFSVRHFSNPRNLSYLMGMFEVSMEKFGWHSDDRKPLGDFPRNILSEGHKNIIRDLSPPFDAFLADELRHIYNESIREMGHTLHKHGIDIRGIGATWDEQPIAAIARTPELRKALLSGDEKLSDWGNIVASATNREAEGPLRCMAKRETKHITGREMREVVAALREDPHLSQTQKQFNALAIHSRSFFNKDFAGYKRVVPTEVVKVFAPLHDVIRPFVSAKWEEHYYHNTYDKQMPTLMEAIAANTTGETTFGNDGRGTRERPSNSVNGAQKPSTDDNKEVDGARREGRSSERDEEMIGYHSSGEGAGCSGEPWEEEEMERDEDGNFILPSDRSDKNENPEKTKDEKDDLMPDNQDTQEETESTWAEDINAPSDDQRPLPPMSITSNLLPSDKNENLEMAKDEKNDLMPINQDTQEETESTWAENINAPSDDQRPLPPMSITSNRDNRRSPVQEFGGCGRTPNADGRKKETPKSIPIESLPEGKTTRETAVGIVEKPKWAIDER